MRSTDIYYVRAFEGPLHERCYRLWKMYAAQAGEGVRVIEVPNPHGWRHAECFNKIFHFARYQPARVVILTEADFLPTPDFAKRIEERLTKEAYGVEYATRDPQTLDPIFHGMPGGWMCALDSDACAEKTIDFEGGGGAFNDPGNQLAEQLDIDIERGRGDDGYGLIYPYGTHMFWSRHYNDPPGTRVVCFDIDDVKDYVEETIETYEELYGLQ